MDPSGISMEPRLMNVASPHPIWFYKNSLSLSIKHRILFKWYNVLIRRNTTCLL